MAELALKICEPGAEPLEDQTGRSPSTDGVLWWDIEAASTVEEILDLAGQHCPGLTRDMLVELTTPDELPLSGGQVYEDGEVRLVSIAGILAENESRSAGDAIGSLSVQPVELLAGRSWLLSCWHSERIYSPIGGEVIADGQRADFRAGVCGGGANLGEAQLRRRGV